MMIYDMLFVMIYRLKRRSGGCKQQERVGVWDPVTYFINFMKFMCKITGHEDHEEWLIARVLQDTYPDCGCSISNLFRAVS
jgi:hypothetical protein